MISVIVPTFNEEKEIGGLLSALALQKVETILVDGGSTDRTVSLAKKYPVKIIMSEKGRSQQMNVGALHASGDVLIFLHADCRLDNKAFTTITTLIKQGYVGGGFLHKIDSDKLIYRVIEFSGNIRARLLKIFYGDQAIFIRKNCFHKLGGFDTVSLFEDILFSKKMKRLGPVIIAKQHVLASPRRWEKRGILKTSVLFWLFTMLFLFGILPHDMSRLYRDVR
ncbi:TIGR04283 family arsenosugar biosynthesis glycosyltransferase [Chlamydiota bacterium]